MKVDGMVEISELLEKMEQQAPGVASQALYDGAGIMAEEIRKSAESIRTAPFQYAREGTRLPSPEEKEIVLAAGAGIAKFNKNGTEVDTSVGYSSSGYAELNGKVKPVPLIVNAINSGTSFMQKQPFVRKAKNSGSTKAMTAMKARIEEAFEAMTKN
jgi:hypothetical protein